MLLYFTFKIIIIRNRKPSAISTLTSLSTQCKFNEIHFDNIYKIEPKFNLNTINTKFQYFLI